jgi:uncharacterized protein (TIGR02246 family)
LALLVLGVSCTPAQDKTGQDKTGKGSKREADKQAVEKLLKELVEAFNNRDAAAIVANWTEDGEFVRNDGDPIRGKANIQKGYAEYFKTLKVKPNVVAEFDALYFPSADTAVSEVTLRLKNPDGEVVASSWRNTLLVREDGKWKVAVNREWDRDIALDTSLKELEWLVGTWEAATKERSVTLTYAWDEHKAFLRGKYTVKEGAKVVEAGTQYIGKDNAEGAIRSWVFQSDGGFAGGVWTRDGKKWSVDVYGVTNDGKELTATSIYMRLDADTFTWQAVDQAVNGEPIADTKPLKVTKQTAAK